MTPVFAQFKYIGVDAQILGGSNRGGQFALGLGFLNQFSAHHGWGVQIVLPFLTNPNPTEGQSIPVPGQEFDVDLAWKRTALPAIAGRYRLFVGNAFFIGSSLQIGLIKETFYADRLASVASGSYPVDPVYLDYELLSPTFRLSFETGLTWTMGSKLYGTLEGRLGVQATHSKVKSFGSFSIGYGQEGAYIPYRGAEAMGGGLIGIGVKL